jgi:hypothetical protein
MNLQPKIQTNIIKQSCFKTVTDLFSKSNCINAISKIAISFLLIIFFTTQGNSYSRYFMLKKHPGVILKSCNVEKSLVNNCNEELNYVSPSDKLVCTSNAGPDAEVCGLVYMLNATPSCGTGTWTKTSGTGTALFSPNANDPDATVTVDVYDSYTFTWTEIDGMDSDFDDVEIIFYEAPDADAGPDQTVCEDSDVTLAGSVTGGTSDGSWSGGSGTFFPDANTLGATYTPSAGEISAGMVTLTLTTDDPSGPCGADMDQITITIDDAATADAGMDQNVCSSSPDVTLAGSVGGAASSGTWSGGAGSFNPDASTLNAIYTPTMGEITNGNVTLTLTTDDPSGLCDPATDEITISFDTPPTANAGPDNTECALSSILDATPTLGTGTWTQTAGPGTASFSPNENDPDATVTVDAYGSYTFTWTEVNGACTDDDVVNITFDAAFYNVNSNEYFCTFADLMADAQTAAGDVVQVPAGTYPDCVIIDKDITLVATSTPVILGCLTMNGVDADLTLGSDIIITSLTLTNGKVHTNGNNLHCGSITGGGAANYIVTD